MRDGDRTVLHIVPSPTAAAQQSLERTGYGVSVIALDTVVEALVLHALRGASRIPSEIMRCWALEQSMTSGVGVAGAQWLLEGHVPGFDSLCQRRAGPDCVLPRLEVTEACERLSRGAPLPGWWCELTEVRLGFTADLRESLWRLLCVATARSGASLLWEVPHLTGPVTGHRSAVMPWFMRSDRVLGAFERTAHEGTGGEHVTVLPTEDFAGAAGACVLRAMVSSDGGQVRPLPLAVASFPSERDECAAVAREVVAQLDSGVPAEGVVVAAPGDLREGILLALVEARVPVFCSAGEAATGSGVLRWLGTVFDLVHDLWSMDRVRSVLGSPYARAWLRGVLHGESAAFERIGAALDAVHADGYEPDGGAALGAALGRMAGAGSTLARAAVNALRALLAPGTDQAHPTWWVDWARGVMDSLSVAHGVAYGADASNVLRGHLDGTAVLDAELASAFGVDQAAFGAALDGLVTVERAFAREPDVRWDASTFVAVWFSLLRGTQLRPGRERAASVRLVTLPELAGMRVDRLFLCGLTDGRLGVPGADGVSGPGDDGPDAEDVVGMGLALGCAAAEQRLFLSWSRESLGGRTAGRSPWLEPVLALQSRASAWEDVVREREPMGRGGPGASFQAARARADVFWSADVQVGVLPDIATAGAPLGVTDLERLAQCPYQFFASAVLRLRARRVQGQDPEARDVGIVAHGCFQRAILWAQRHRESHPWNESGREALGAEIGEAFDDGVKALGWSPFRREHMRSRLVGQVKALVIALYDREVPDEVWVEQAFGEGNGWPPVTLGDGVNLRGRVDWVSRAGPQYTVHDLKSGAVNTLKAQLGPDVLARTHFQLPVYAQAVEAFARSRHGEQDPLGGALVVDGCLLSLKEGQATPSVRAWMANGRTKWKRDGRTWDGVMGSRALGGVIEPMIAAARTGAVPVAPQEGACARCDHSALCRVPRHVMRGGADDV